MDEVKRQRTKDKLNALLDESYLRGHKQGMLVTLDFLVEQGVIEEDIRTRFVQELEKRS